jgi:hypothetical protein
MGQALTDYSDKGEVRDARVFCLKATMINIVGKIMLPDIPHSCQDEYAATRPETRKGEKRVVFAAVSAKGAVAAARVNVNAAGRVIDAIGVKHEKATPV